MAATAVLQLLPLQIEQILATLFVRLGLLYVSTRACTLHVDVSFVQPFVIVPINKIQHQFDIFESSSRSQIFENITLKFQDN